MANVSNLIPNSKRSPSEVRENSRKGGIKSGKVRRERRKLKEELELLLKQGHYQEKICLSLINKAINGDVRAFETIRETIGENYKDVKIAEDISTRVIIVDDLPSDELD